MFGLYHERDIGRVRVEAIGLLRPRRHGHGHPGHLGCLPTAPRTARSRQNGARRARLAGRDSGPPARPGRRANPQVTPSVSRRPLESAQSKPEVGSSRRLAGTCTTAQSGTRAARGCSVRLARFADDPETRGTGRSAPRGHGPRRLRVHRQAAGARGGDEVADLAGAHGVAPERQLGRVRVDEHDVHAAWLTASPRG